MKHGLKGIYTKEDGEISFKVKISPDKQMQIRLYYDGQENVHFVSNDARNSRIRLFDLKACGKTFATQNVSNLKPTGGIEFINYPIPLGITNGKTEITITLKSKDFGSSRGIVGTLYDKVKIFFIENN